MKYFTSDFVEMFAKIGTTDPRRHYQSRFKIRPAVTVRDGNLSGFVSVVTEIGYQEYHRQMRPIVFSRAFTEYAARYLPMGIGPQNKAQLVVADRYHVPYIEVIVCYDEGLSHPVLLWREDEMPEWAK